MSRLFCFLLLHLILIFSLSAQDIPQNAVILEKAKINRNRQLILWMPDPVKYPRDVNEIYTCPEETRGHYYSGVAKVSLVDLRTRKNVNTISIDANGEQALDLPYLIHRGYYKVPKVDHNKEGKPVLMNLKDYNNDGKPLEFALFNALACMGLETTLIGYSERQDRVIQFPIELKANDKTYYGFWADYLFINRPNKQNIWIYQIDYRGRAGSLDKYEFHYDRKNEKFAGKLYSLFEESRLRRR